MKLFKFLLPKEDMQAVTVAQSWMIYWTVAGHIDYGIKRTYCKAFLKFEDALEFKKQLEVAAKLLKTPILINSVENE